MRPLTRTALWLLMAAGPALAAASPDAGAPLPRIVVAFANEPLAAPGPAGTTGSRYGGTGYGVGQSAQRQAHKVATAYGLREVTSWPIQMLSMHCVVFEIASGRPMADVLAELSKDSRVVLAQPLQEFHTLTAQDATAEASTTSAASPASATAPAGAPYNDPLYDLQTNMTALGIARAHERTQAAGGR